MAITVDIQDNPVFATYNDAGDVVETGIGSLEADCTIISSGFTDGVVKYIVARYDAWEGDHTYAEIFATGIAGAGVEPADWISVDSSHTYGDSIPQIVSISASELHVILKPRSDYAVIVSHDGGDWSAGNLFKTRDKKYSTPDAITQLTSVIEYTDAGADVTVTNNAKASVEETDHGATVTVTESRYTETETEHGATIVVN